MLSIVKAAQTQVIQRAKQALIHKVVLPSYTVHLLLFHHIDHFVKENLTY